MTNRLGVRRSFAELVCFTLLGLAHCTNPGPCFELHVGFGILPQAIRWMLTCLDLAILARSSRFDAHW